MRNILFKRKISKTHQRTKAGIRTKINNLKNTLFNNKVTNQVTNINTKNSLTAIGYSVTELANFNGDATHIESQGMQAFILKKGNGANAISHLYVELGNRSDHSTDNVKDIVKATMEKLNPLERTSEIVLSLKESDLKDVDVEMEQMVADMNEEARAVGGLQFQIERDVVINPNKKRLVKFKLSPLVGNGLGEIMTVDELQQGLGKDKNKRPRGWGSREYNDMVTTLNDFHLKLNTLNNTLDTNSDSPKILEEVNESKIALSAVIDSYLLKNADSQNVGKKNAPERLKEQINDSIFKNLKRKFNPIEVTGNEQVSEIGSGSQGTIRAMEFENITINGVPVNHFEAAVKMDSGETSPPAIGMGIKDGNPQQSRRAVATYEIASKLELDIVPRTTFAIETIDGKTKIGQAIEKVKGIKAQIKKNGVHFSPDEINALNIQEADNRQIENNPNLQLIDEFKHFDRDANNKIIGGFKITKRVPDIDYGNAKLQKGLSDLQVFDNIIGAPDRHEANFIIETTDNHEISGVKGIDNDDTLGSQTDLSSGTKTPGIPPIIDVDTAIKILSYNEADLKITLQKHLSVTESESAVTRLREVKQIIKDRVREGGLATSDGILTVGKKFLLKGLADFEPESVKTWGTEEVTASHINPKSKIPSKQNSYLGRMIAYKGYDAEPEIGGTEPVEYNF